jgi:hypothetical protein
MRGNIKLKPDAFPHIYHQSQPNNATFSNKSTYGVGVVKPTCINLRKYIKINL